MMNGTEIETGIGLGIGIGIGTDIVMIGSGTTGAETLFVKTGVTTEEMTADVPALESAKNVTVYHLHLQELQMQTPKYLPLHLSRTRS
jgi:hypothetical protein